MISAALGMTDNYVACPGIRQHFCRDITRMRAALIGVAGLTTHFQFRSVRGLRGNRQKRGWHTQKRLHSGLALADTCRGIPDFPGWPSGHSSSNYLR